MRRFATLGLDSYALSTLRRLSGEKWLPNPRHAASAVAELARKISQRLHTPADWSELWFKKMQQKYRSPASYASHSNIASGTPRLSIGTALVMLPKHDAQAIRNVFEYMGLTKLNNSLLIPALKELGEVAKHHGDDAFPGIWHHLVDWNLHFGAQPIDKEETTEKFVEQVNSWVFEPKPEDAAGSTREKVIFRGLELLREIVGVPLEPGPAWEKVMSEPTGWLANGSSTSRRLPGSRGTKVSTYLASDNAMLTSDLYDESCPSYGVEVKEERGKLRNIMNAPWSLYLQMKFVGLGGLQRLYDRIPTSLSKKFSSDTWINWMDRMKYKLYVPIDQSTYDHVPSGRVLEALLEFICTSCTHHSDHERVRVSSIIRERSRNGEVRFAGRVWPHRRGILSGLDWTAAMDTVLNYAEFLGMCEELGIERPDPQDLCFQGDDTLAGVSGWGDAYELVRGYMKVFPVNPTKFFLDRERTEYLRLVCTPQRRFGYYARLAAGIMYSNVWSGGAMAPSSIANVWSLLHSRGADLQQTQRHCVDDLCGLLRCRKLEARRLLFTPAAVGGLGFTGRCPGPWLALEDAKRVRVAQREVVATPWDAVPRAARVLAVRSITSRGGIMSNRSVATGAAQAMAAGLQGYAGARPDTIFKVVDSQHTLRSGARKEYFTPTLPKSRVDPTFLPELLRLYLRNRRLVGTDEVGDPPLLSDLFDHHSLPLVEERFRAWPRKVWFDWCCGRLSAPAGKGWGDAPDLLGTIKKDCESMGLVPTGAVTVLAVRTRALELELESRSWRTRERRMLGG